MNLPVLDLYILSLLDRGVSSLYDLQKTGGLSLGASTPALKRLQKAKLVTKGEEHRAGRRVRYDFSLTPTGQQEAKKGWRLWVEPQNFPFDIDAILRVVDMAMCYRYPSGELRRLLLAAAEIRASDRGRKGHRGSASSAIGIYQRLRQRYEQAVLIAEVKALREIAAQLGGTDQRRSKRRLTRTTTDSRP